jgi:hypothetical protein
LLAKSTGYSVKIPIKNLFYLLYSSILSLLRCMRA